MWMNLGTRNQNLDPQVQYVNVQYKIDVAELGTRNSEPSRNGFVTVVNCKDLIEKFYII